jgi:uncharacterized coiled-coil protein SlyX
MEVVDTTQINSFAPVAAQTDFPVSPSEESVFILTSDQLQDLIKEAIQPLQDRIGSLEARITTQDENIAFLESTQEQDTTRICVDIAHDRQRIAKLERVEPQPMQKDRGEILRALIVANGGKMLATEARKKMHLSRSRFSELLATVKDEIEVKPYHLNKSWKVLVL